MNILVVGRGGREHALCEKIKASSHVQDVYVAPGNPGMADVATLVPYEENAHEMLIQFAKENNIDLVFIGPEQPLVDGLADLMKGAGINVFGPSQNAAQIEGSKLFAKELMLKYGIPTARYKVFDDYALARSYIEKMPTPIVIKADGLAAGKGVVVAQTKEEADAALVEMLQDKKYGKASTRVIIEECLVGEEFSLMALVHGEIAIPLDIAKDHKRAYDDDLGPNTGGMGAYSPVYEIPPTAIKQAITEILEPTAKALVKEGMSFTGVLYAGLMLTEDGCKVIEFNARFGDPETQVLLPRLESDLIEAVLELLAGRKPILSWSKDVMLGVVVASQGYPGPCQLGIPLPIYDVDDENLFIYYSGVGSEQNAENRLISAGGRVYLAGYRADNIETARKKVYSFLGRYKQPEFFYRTDIGK